MNQRNRGSGYNRRRRHDAIEMTRDTWDDVETRLDPLDRDAAPLVKSWQKFTAAVLVWETSDVDIDEVKAAADELMETVEFMRELRRKEGGEAN